jgi:hypothetical protein
MPTAARLFAAIGLALVAFFAAELYKPGLSGETRWGNFTWYCVAFGAVVGWIDLGRLSGKGYGPAITTGIRSAAVLTFWCLLVFSAHAMWAQALKGRYKGIGEAIVKVFDFAVEFGTALLRPEPVIVLVVGGVLAAFLAEWASKRWP